jgi:hypothetical protein
MIWGKIIERDHIIKGKMKTRVPICSYDMGEINRMGSYNERENKVQRRG